MSTGLGLDCLGFSFLLEDLAAELLPFIFLADFAAGTLFLIPWRGGKASTEKAAGTILDGPGSGERDSSWVLAADVLRLLVEDDVEVVFFLFIVGGGDSTCGVTSAKGMDPYKLPETSPSTIGSDAESRTSSAKCHCCLRRSGEVS